MQVSGVGLSHCILCSKPLRKFKSASNIDRCSTVVAVIYDKVSLPAYVNGRGCVAAMGKCVVHKSKGQSCEGGGGRVAI